MNYNIENDQLNYMKKNIFFILILLPLLSLNAQFGEKKETQSQQEIKTPSVQQAAFISDGVVDPKEYIVGPGDIFAVSIYAGAPLNFQVPVTPEGTVIIPTVAEIFIANKTLDSAKLIVTKEIKRKYLSGISSFTLFSPRTIAVTVKGAVKQEGIRYIQSTRRVDAVINTPISINREDERLPDITIAQRKILLRHRDGTTHNVDLEKYYASQNTYYNPYLRDGDIIVIPQRNIENDFVSVYGAVIKQQTYEYVDGDSLLSMLSIARGLNALADSERVEITRFEKTDGLKKIDVNLRKIKSGEQTDVPLQRGDRIVVYEQYTPQRDYKVYIVGEVRFPGIYPIRKDSTLLSEIIEVAGGITEYASLRSSQLFRRTVSESEINTERKESARGGITPDDSAYYYLETDIRINRELVVTDFSGVIRQNDKSKDIYLRDNDYILIASKKKTIYVFGQVVNPGHIPFEQNKDFNYYISKAGGLTEYARTGDIKIIKAATRQWLSPDETIIEDGDYIWIPKEPYRPFTYYLTVYSQVFGIVATVVSLVLLVTR